VLFPWLYTRACALAQCNLAFALRADSCGIEQFANLAAVIDLFISFRKERRKEKEAKVKNAESPESG